MIDTAAAEAGIRDQVQRLTGGAVQRGQAVEVRYRLGNDHLQVEFFHKRVKSGGIIPLVQKKDDIALVEKGVGGVKPVGQLVLQLALAQIQGVIRRQIDQGKGGRVEIRQISAG